MGINHRPLLRSLLRESRIACVKDVHHSPDDDRVPCVADAHVHWVRDEYAGDQYLMHVSCHGEHRIVTVSARDVAAHAATAPGVRLELLWLTLRDACPKDDLREWRRSVLETIGEGRQLALSIEDVIRTNDPQDAARQRELVGRAPTLPPAFARDAIKGGSFDIAGSPMSGTCDECGLDLAWAARHGATGHAHDGPRVFRCSTRETVEVTQPSKVAMRTIALREFDVGAVAKAPGVRPRILVDLQDEP